MKIEKYLTNKTLTPSDLQITKEQHVFFKKTMLQRKRIQANDHKAVVILLIFDEIMKKTSQKQTLKPL